MYKIGQLVDGEEREFTHPAKYSLGKRLVAGVPNGETEVLDCLIDTLAPPLLLLYVLHTPRGEADPGRYQSPELSVAVVRQFISKFASFLRSDSRYDLWIYSPADDATLVWDRHNLLYGYGPHGKFVRVLELMGFVPGKIEVPTPHMHYCRPENDPTAKELIKSLEWVFSPLQPEDHQEFDLVAE